ncbi:uncharacterized protein [Ptychodera flava]|uniref:uncharacterized protein n=1 Tax=Ptychodera flava TaxID=63121 RepID=UPI003969EB0E
MGDFDNLTVPQLKDFLRKFGISTWNYRKNILVTLAKAVRDAGFEEDPDMTGHDPKRDVSKRLADLGCSFDNPLNLPGYSTDFSAIPDFGLCDVFNYLICHRSDYDRKKLRAYKSYEDFRLCYDGHVFDLQYTQISEASTFGAFKAQVKPTQKDKTYLSKSTYTLWFLMDKAHSEIMAAYCECPGGADGACRHVAAALYEVESFEKSSVTDGPCLWKRRPMEHDQPVPIKRLKIKQAHYSVPQLNTPQDSDFDPRHPDDRTPLSQIQQELFAKGLAQISPGAAALTLLMPPTLGNNPESESAEACLHLAMVNKLRMFLRTHLNEHLKASTQTLAAMFVENVQYTKEEVELIERQTVGQNENTIWHELRKGIITASQFRQVTSRANTLLKDPSADPTKTVDKILGEGTVPSEDLPAPQWGRKKEGKAREMYRAIERRKHKHLNVRVPGLRVDDRRPFFGCSTDGVVTCRCKPKHQPKLLEIKCPFARRYKSPKDAAKDKGCQEDLMENGL